MFVFHDTHFFPSTTEMQLKTILNSVTDYKSFVFTNIDEDVVNEDDTTTKCIVAEIEPRKNSQGVCPECNRQCTTYDTAQHHRWFEFVPLWNTPVWFVYKMRRVTCPEHGVVTEKVPWGDGKNTQTVEHRQFLANWARRLSWKETAECFGTTPGKVFRAVKWIVEWGLKHRDLSGVTKIGVDEISRSKGHKYMTLVYQLDEDNKRLLGVEKNREEKSLERFFDKFDEGSEGENKRSDEIEFVCSDMLKAYLNVIRKRCPNALNILDRFHVKGHLTKAVDETRKLDVAKLKLKRKEEVLTKSKYIFLKNPENLTDKQAVKLKELLQCNLRVIRAYLMKEDFERFWKYKRSFWAGRFLDEWCVRAMRSKIDPMKKFVGTVRNHRELLLNWFKSKGLSSGIVEGFNNKVKLTVRKGYGYGSDESLKITLFHALGKLPEPKFTHRFW
jgi:transposase